MLIKLFIFHLFVFAQSSGTLQTESTEGLAQEPSLSNVCLNFLMSFPGPKSEKLTQAACAKVQHLPKCQSVEKRPIFHYEKKSERANAKNILVFSLIHGDERPAGSVATYWMERLETIDSRNSWRVIPVLNPDGYLTNTRVNANKIDLNRNFPTKDWSELALDYWRKKTQENPRRYPGPTPASEPETQCALLHIEDFQPHFIVSIHTPLKVLDFDGPKTIRPPRFDLLPWRSLGHYPGSLGRYMWSERNTPVLTMELESQAPTNYLPFEKLQDIIGTLVGLESQ